MSQSPTPNMQLVLPTDHGSNDIWDTIFDTSYQLIDAHDHTPGKGVKIPAAALNINADVSWSSGGTSHSIMDLVAVDFAPVATSIVAGLAGALFLNSADSNLYWRTPGGSNVQLTAGAALNVAAFTGGIGGDYAAVGALELFDDATDSYWFQQQAGGGVRQYARMRSADVDLYEYKANPAAGVPANRVRLASPTSLAASYAVTFPAAVPSASTALRMASTGTLVLGAAKFYHCCMAVQGGGTATFDLDGVRVSASSTTLLCPFVTSVGDSLDSWNVRINKPSGSGTIIQALLYDLNQFSGVFVNRGSQSNATASPGIISLGQTGLGITAQTDHAYVIKIIWIGADPAADILLGWSTAG